MPAAATNGRLAAALSRKKNYIGQVFIAAAGDYFLLRHRDDPERPDLNEFCGAEHAADLARFDDHGKFRPLKTAPNLRHGWQLRLVGLDQLRRALDYFYPGRLDVFLAWDENRLRATPLRETLNRQSGMYRIAAKISDEQIGDTVGRLCRSDGGCLRTILWKQDQNGTVPSMKLSPEKFDPAFDQTGQQRETIPLLCQEACPLLVNECRNAVKAGSNE